MKKKILSILLAALMLLSLAACGGNNATDGNATDGNIPTEESAAPAPTPFFTDFTTTGLDGKEYTQEIFTGNKLTMVNVWGTFCPPCIKEMPDLEKLSKAYADKGVVIIGIASDTFDYLKGENSEAKVKTANEIISEAGVTYLNLLPSESLNKAKLDYITTWPTTYFLNENGEIVTGEYIASRSYEQWASIIDSLLETL